MPDRKLRRTRWLPVWRVVYATAIELQQIGARGMEQLGLQAQCVGGEGATFCESVVSKISGQRSLRLSGPTNDVTAHAGRIGSCSEYERPHSHSLLRAVTQLTRKLFRRTTSCT